jgi:hypothetical protein
LVCTNGAGPSIERSTWLSAAKFTTARGRCSAKHPRHDLAVGDVALHEDHAPVVEQPARFSRLPA